MRAKSDVARYAAAVAAVVLLLGVAWVLLHENDTSPTTVSLGGSAEQAPGSASKAPNDPSGAPLLRGVVLEPDGTPATGAHIQVATAANYTMIHNSAVNSVRPFITKGDGVFSLARPVDEFALVVVSDKGFARVKWRDCSANMKVQLQAWARVVGKLAKNEAGISQKIILGAYGPGTSGEPWFINHDVRTQTDAAGNFVFEQVAPVPCYVAVEYPGKEMKAYAQAIDPKPGETVVVALGTGRSVTGLVEIKELKPGMKFVGSWMNLRPPVSEREVTAAGGALPAEVRTTLFTNRFPIPLDGEIRIDGLPAGSYQVTASLMQNNPISGQEEVVGTVSKTIQVPEGQSEKPVELGTLSIEVGDRLAPGSKAPDFAMTTADGKTVKLSSFAGKYVLLVFHDGATGLVDLTPVKVIGDLHGDSEQLVILAVKLDAPDVQQGTIAKPPDIPDAWVNAHFGADQAAPKEYLASGPYTYFIAPDGEVMASNLAGLKLYHAVDRVMSGKRMVFR